MTLCAHPAGQAGFAAALLDPDMPCPSVLCTCDGGDPDSRFAVYRNNVVSSLVDALVDTFPVVQALVGPEFFRAMAAVFVRRSPPASRVLAFYGHEFPDFIASFEPARSVPYLADVARLEMARVQAYHAADADAVDPGFVGAVLAAGVDVEHLRLEFHPSVHVVASTYAVVSVWAAHQVDGDVDLAPVDIDQPEAALVCRVSLDAAVVPLAPGAARFIGILKSGGGLGDAAAVALAGMPELDVSTTLGMLFAHGAVTAIKTPSETTK